MGGSIGYYDEYLTDSKTKLYDQKMTVADQPNPPPGEFSVNNNLRQGYADYRPGMYYIAAFECLSKTPTYLTILKKNESELSNQRRQAAIQCLPNPTLGEEALMAMEKIRAGEWIPGLKFIEEFLTPDEERR